MVITFLYASLECYYQRLSDATQFVTFLTIIIMISIKGLLIQHIHVHTCLIGVTASLKPEVLW